MGDPALLSNSMYCFLPTELEGFTSLAEWPSTCAGRGTMPPTKSGGGSNPSLWEFTRNPWVVLQTVSRETLTNTLAEPSFMKKVNELLQAKREAATRRPGFSRITPNRR